MATGYNKTQHISDWDVWNRIESGLKQAGFKKIATFLKGTSGTTRRKIYDRYGKHYEIERYDDPNFSRVYFIKKREAKLRRNEYYDAIVDRLTRQNEKGLKKYGYMLQDNTELTIDERLEHLAEELTDGLQYIEHIKTLNAQVVDTLILNVSTMIILAGRITNQEIADVLRKRAEETNRVLGLMKNVRK
jgi:hypothetical protein